MELSRFIKAASLAGIALSTAALAEAGEWRLNPAACPDLREDRIDARVVTGRRDLKEDIRDARQVNCPASAWTYVPSRWERRVKRPKFNQARAVVYVDPRGYYYYPKGKTHAPSFIKVVVK